MNTTINEEIAHDCVQKLLEKLADERKLSSTQNARIAELEEQVGQAMDLSHEELAVVMAMRSTGAMNDYGVCEGCKKENSDDER